MSSDKDRGFEHGLSDRERAELRGKGRAPDFEPGSEEGTTFEGEIGMRGDDTGLRGHETSERSQGKRPEERHALQKAEGTPDPKVGEA